MPARWAGLYFGFLGEIWNEECGVWAWDEEVDSEQMRSGFSLEVKEEPKSQQTKRSSDYSGGGHAKQFGSELSCK